MSFWWTLLALPRLAIPSLKSFLPLTYSLTVWVISIGTRYPKFAIDPTSLPPPIERLHTEPWFRRKLLEFQNLPFHLFDLFVGSSGLRVQGFEWERGFLGAANNCFSVDLSSQIQGSNSLATSLWL